MQISAHLAFSYNKPVGPSLLLPLQNTCHHKLDASQSESDLHSDFGHKKQSQHDVCYGRISVSTSPY